MSFRARVCLLLLSALLAGCTLFQASSGPDPNASPAPSGVPHLKHVVVIILENASFDEAVRNSDVAVAAQSGALLRRYFGITHHSLPNYLALASGATPSDVTKADCPKFNCAIGDPSIASQLDAAKLSWKAYFGATNEPCRTPEPGQKDAYQRGYLTHHNPFAYYPALGANASGGTETCQSHLRSLSELGDNAGSGQLPNFSLVVPDSCEDGHDVPCADGRPGGVSTAGPWMSRTIATITQSKDWGKDSLLAVTFDEGGANDSAGCCGGQGGGGHIATIMISPLVRAGTFSDHDYDHYSLLRTIEDGLGLSGHLGAAGDPLVGSISDIWNSSASPQPGR